MPWPFHRKKSSKSDGDTTPTPPPTPPATDLPARMNALNIAPPRPADRRSAPPRPFVGGFAPASTPPRAPAMPSPGVGGFQAAAPPPRPPAPYAMPTPSLTMQHAMSTPYVPQPGPAPTAHLHPPRVPHPVRPHSDPVTPTAPAFRPVPYAYARPNTPPPPPKPYPPPPKVAHRPLSDPNVAPVKPAIVVATDVQAPRPPRRRRESTPASPTVSAPSSSNGDAVQCGGVTKAGKRCTRQVKLAGPIAQVDEDGDADADGGRFERFCFQHSRELMTQSGFYARKNGKWIEFKDWIPEYLAQDTQVAIRVEMEKSKSMADQPGYIYTFEIRDDKTPSHVHLKVGRAVNLTKRIDEWGKQCKSKEPVLRGWYPGHVDADEGSLLKGRVQAGAKGPYCHRLERLVHLELADLVANRPYLDPKFPNVDAPAGGAARKADVKCKDCGQTHKEVFTFERPQSGPYQDKEFEKLVFPVIEKWGGFIAAYL